MINFLQNLNIVQAFLAFREGEILKISIESHLSIADKLIIMLDNYDKETEKIVLEYKNKYPDRIEVGYSTIKGKESNIPFGMNKRFKSQEGIIRQQLLDLVKIEHNRKPIDILLWADADEIFTNHFPKVLEWFWKTNKLGLLCNGIQMIDNFNTFHNRRFYSHCKAFRYIPELSSIPMRGQCLLNPCRKYANTTRGYYSFVHLADFNIDYIKKRKNYKIRSIKKDSYVWKIDKDVRDLTSEEYNNIIENIKPLCSMEEYLKQYG